MMGLGKSISGFKSGVILGIKLLNFREVCIACVLALYHLDASVAQRGMAHIEGYYHGAVPGDSWEG